MGRLPLTPRPLTSSRASYSGASLASSVCASTLSPSGMSWSSPQTSNFQVKNTYTCSSTFFRSHTTLRDGSGSQLEKELKDAEIVISQPFFPFYLTAERMAMAPKLKIAITAGIGSDHVDLAAAMKNKVDVVEVTYCNSISVAEHVVMMILGLVRNYMPSHKIVISKIQSFPTIKKI